MLGRIRGTSEDLYHSGAAVTRGQLIGTRLRSQSLVWHVDAGAAALASLRLLDAKATPAPKGRTPEGTARCPRSPRERRRATVPNLRSRSASRWLTRPPHPGCSEALSRKTAHQPRAAQ